MTVRMDAASTPSIEGIREAIVDLSGRIQVATATLTSAQILQLFTTAVTVVAAPNTPGNAIIPLHAVFNYTAGSTPYTDGGGHLRLTTTNVGFWTDFATAGFWDQSHSMVNAAMTVNSLQASTANYANNPLLVTETIANPTLGNGSMTVTVYYIQVPVV